MAAINSWICLWCNTEHPPAATQPTVCGKKTSKGPLCRSQFFKEKEAEEAEEVVPEPAVAPTVRPSGWYKKGFHNGPIGCVLFAVKKNSKNAVKIGKEYHSGNKQALWSNHAEKQWWGDTDNAAELKKIYKDPDLVQLEFEITGEFCDKGCKGLFKEVRTHVPGEKHPVYIFMMRERTYYEVNSTGEVMSKGRWAGE